MRSWTQSRLARVQLRLLSTQASLRKVSNAIAHAGFSLATACIIVAIAAWNSGARTYTFKVPVRDLFLAEGAAFATVLTLAFSLAMITIQRAAQDFSTGVLVTYARDVRVQAVFFILALLTVLAFAIAASANNDAAASGLGALAIIMVAIALDSLRWLYRRVAVALQPEAAIGEMLRYALRDIGQRERLARLLQRAYLGRPGAGPQARATAAVAFASVSGYSRAIRRWSEFLAEDALRSVARRQSFIASLAINAIGQLGIKAMDVRAQDALFARDPQDLFVTTSDLQKVIGPLLELLAEIGRKSLEGKDSNTAIAVARTLVAMASRASTVSGESTAGDGSLVVSHMLMFKDLIEDGIKLNDRELPFQGIQILDGAAAHLAPRVSPYGFVLQVSGLVQAVAIYHLARKGEAIAGSVTTTLLRLTGICLTQEPEEHVGQVNAIFASAVPIYRVAMLTAPPNPLRSALDGMFRTQPLWGEICDGLYERAVANNGAELTKWSRRVSAFAEGLGALLRELFALQAGRDSVLIVGIVGAAQPILRTLALLARREKCDQRTRSDLLDSHSELTATLARFTNAPDESTWRSVDDIADVLAIESFELLGPQTFDAVDEAVNSLISIANSCVQSGKLREASEVMLRIWMLEQIAGHRQHQDLEEWLAGRRAGWLNQLGSEARVEVERYLAEALEQAESTLAGRDVLRLRDRAIAVMAAIMGRRLRGMFE
jgi:hypothetical protein